MQRNTSQGVLKLLLLLNCVGLIAHMANDFNDVYYFFQLTIIGQILVTMNFYLSLTLNEQKVNLKIKLILSRLHLVTLSLEAVVCLGFWGLRVFFARGIIAEGSQRSILDQVLSIYVHGGSFITMFYFIRTDQILLETRKRKKYVVHLLWAIPFLGLQYLHWVMTGKHIYGFISHFTWVQLIVFEVILFVFAVGCDYFLSIRHGFKLLKQYQNRQTSNIEKIVTPKGQ